MIPFIPDGPIPQKPVLIPEVTPMLLESMGRDQHHFELLQKIDIRSMMILPMEARKKIIGVFMLGMTVSNRRFTQEDVSFGELIALRSAIAVDNSSLYDEAQKAIRAREDILAMVSHDLKNPLTVIKSGCDILDQVIEKRERGEGKLIHSMLRASSNMEKMINDLLDYSKIQEGSLRLQLSEISTAKLIEEVSHLYQKKAKEKSIELTCHTPDPPVTFRGDPDRMVQILNNIVGNAIKFTPEKGKVSITVKDESRMLHFLICDTGPGIDKDALKSVFERYWQAKETAHKGSGLGLFISKALVQAHGGKIWAESDNKTGTTFHFTIPKAAAV